VLAHERDDGIHGLAHVREHVVEVEVVALAMGVGVPVWSPHDEVIAALAVAVSVKDAQSLMRVPALTVALRGSPGP
jgi:mannitol/fructose-specific phosphotransferase system IIA component